MSQSADHPARALSELLILVPQIWPLTRRPRLAWQVRVDLGDLPKMPTVQWAQFGEVQGINPADLGATLSNTRRCGPWHISTLLALNCGAEALRSDNQNKEVRKAWSSPSQAQPGRSVGQFAILALARCPRVFSRGNSQDHCSLCTQLTSACNNVETTSQSICTLWTLGTSCLWLFP